MLTNSYKKLASGFTRFVARMHQTPYNSEIYAEKFVLSHDLFKTRIDTKQPPFVMLHGLLGSKSNWRPIGRNLNRSGREVIVFDLRNHGRSPHSKFMSYDIMANDVKHSLKKVLPTHRKFDLFGHSMGGKVAMVLALKNPDLVSRLVVVDILPEYTKSTGAFGAEILFKALEEVTVDKSKPLPDARQSVIDQLMAKINDVKVSEWLATNLDWTPERGVFWKCNLKVLHERLNEVLIFPEFEFEPFTKPTLFIQGQRSPLMNKPNRDEIVRRYFPKAEFEAIPDAGHWVHYDKPFELIRTVNSFLSANPSS